MSAAASSSSSSSSSFWGFGTAGLTSSSAASPPVQAATAAEELAPLSALELVAPLTLRAGGLLAAVAAGEDPLDRMLAAVRFLLSTLAAGTAPPCGRGRAATSYRNTVQRAGVLRRPHMPIVGEMCVAWHRLGGGEGGGPGPLAVSVAEQVSYKPRLTAACTAVPELDVVFAGVAEPRARLAGPNRLEVWLAGERRLELRGRGEAYVFGASPRFLVRNLLLGATFGEFVGEARVACTATGLEAVLEFRPTPAGAAQPAHEVAGAVFRTAGDGVRREVRRLKGSWDKAVVAWVPQAGGSGQNGGGGPAAEPAVVFDFVADMADFQAAEVEVPEDALAAQVPEWISDKPMTSQELWRDVNRHVEAGEHKQTRKSKKVLTAGQRAYAADLAASGQPHCPRFFDPPAAAAGPGACWRPRLHHVAALARAAFPETPRTWGREEQW